MLVREGGGGAVESRLRMRDQLDRNARHHLRIAPLEPEPLAERRVRQHLAQLEAEPAGEHDRARPVGERIVADEAAERMAEAVDGRGAKAVLAGDAALPDRAVVELLDLAL